MPSLLMNWVPRKLAPNIRCVFTMIDGTPQHKALIQREPQPFTLQLTPLTDDNRQVCNVSYLVQSQSHLAWIRRIMLICFFFTTFSYVSYAYSIANLIYRIGQFLISSMLQSATLRPSHPTWPVSAPIVCTHHRHINLEYSR